MDLCLKPKVKNKVMLYSDYCSILKREIEEEHIKFAENCIKWEIKEGVTRKVNTYGQYLKFCGDTIVWPCDEKSIKNCFELQKKVYSSCSDLLAEPLDPSFFHITIHDLNNEFNVLNPNDLEIKMEDAKLQAFDVFKNLNDYLANNPEDSFINLNSIGLSTSNMVSFVLKFIPASERDFNIMMNLYNLFDEIVYLDYFLRPHISLGYFLPSNVGKYGMKEISKLMEYSRMHTIDVTVNIKEIVYQRFNDMNNYLTCVGFKKPHK